MNVTLQKTPAETAFLDAAAAVDDPRRRQALEMFIGMGLPHRRLEDWRWTDLRQLIDGAYPPAPAARKTPGSDGWKRSPLLADVRYRLVVIDGVYLAEASLLPADVTVEAMPGSSGLREPPVEGTATDPIRVMNTAFLSGSVALRVRAGTTLDLPIEIVSLTTAGERRTLASRLMLDIGDGASASFIETHIDEGGPHLTCAVTEARIGNGARLDRIKLQLENPEAIHLANFEVAMGSDAILRDCTLTAGGRVTRQQGFASFEGERSDARILGAYLLRNRQHCDTRLVVDHRAPACTSREIFKCVVDDEARGVFQGKVIVQRGAQKTDGKQSSHGLLLSPTAEFDAKPELEIYADDVACGHGATAGELDENMMFYLRSRGVPPAEARALLVAAFAAEALGDIAHDGIRERLGGLVEDWVRGAEIG